MSRLALFVDNNKYRLGDAIMNDSYDSQLLTANRYKKSFLFRYLANKNFRPVQSLGLCNSTLSPLQELGLPRRVRILALTLNEVVHGSAWEVPSPDELVVHLRLGDVFKFSGDETREYVNCEDVLKKIKMSKKTEVVIVTALHYPSCTVQSSDTTLEKDTSGLSVGDVSCDISKHENDDAESTCGRSVALLNDLKDKIIKTGKSVRVRSSKDVDSDFIYLCFSTELVLSGISGFGRAAYTIHQLIMGHPGCIADSQPDNDWVALAPRLLQSLRQSYIRLSAMVLEGGQLRMS